jgi:hypothetical protein
MKKEETTTAVTTNSKTAATSPQRESNPTTIPRPPVGIVRGQKRRAKDDQAVQTNGR